MLNKTLNAVHFAANCIGATIDTISDKQVKVYWEAKQHAVKQINKKRLQKLSVIYSQYKQKADKINKSAKEAKRIAEQQFTGIVKAVFSSHLQQRQLNQKIKKQQNIKKHAKTLA